MSHLMTSAQDQRSADAYVETLTAAMRAAKQIRSDFVASLSPRSPAYDLEWELRYGSEDRLIFVFSVVIDLAEDFDVREYPRDAVNRLTADLRERIGGTEIDAWDVWVVTVTARPRPLFDVTMTTTPSSPNRISSRHVKTPVSRASGLMMPRTRPTGLFSRSSR